jgi:hypothetical protein
VGLIFLRGGGGQNGRDFWEIFGERVRRGYPFLEQGKRKNCVKLYKIVSFDPFWDLQGRKTLKTR